MAKAKKETMIGTLEWVSSYWELLETVSEIRSLNTMLKHFRGKHVKITIELVDKDNEAYLV